MALTRMTCAESVALQLEAVAAMLPTLFPGRIVTCTVRYRYTYEKEYRVKHGIEFWLAKYPSMFMATDAKVYEREALAAAKHRLRRWHWKDHKGHIRRVKDVLITITAERDDPPNKEHRASFARLLPEHYLVSSRKIRVPMRTAAGSDLVILS